MKQVSIFFLIIILFSSCSTKQRLIKGYEDDFPVELEVTYIYGEDTLSNLYDWQIRYNEDELKQEHSILLTYTITKKSDKLLSLSAYNPEWMVSRNNQYLIGSNLNRYTAPRRISNYVYQDEYRTIYAFDFIPELQKGDVFVIKGGYNLYLGKKSKLIQRKKFIKSFEISDNTTKM